MEKTKINLKLKMASLAVSQGDSCISNIWVLTFAGLNTYLGFIGCTSKDVQRPSFLTLTIVVKKFLISSAAGFESVQSVQKNGGNYVHSVVAAAEFYILVMESAACLTEIKVFRRG